MIFMVYKQHNIKRNVYGLVLPFDLVSLCRQRSLQGVYEVRDGLVDNKEVTCPCIDFYCDVV